MLKSKKLSESLF
uniref:Uncharacterized protein n=1 Tax=Megaselia scalaris TaxID=36166 RepID=T1GEW2_MEGSC